MMVLAVAGVALALTVPIGMDWIVDYKHSGGSRAFVNAAQLVRIRSIGGPVTMDITEIGLGSGGSDFFAIKVSAFKPSADEPPFQEGDYLTLSGLNNPDYLNGLMFRITDVPSSYVPDGSGTYPEVTITAKCCSENDPNDCVEWTPTTTPISTTTGLIRIASSLKFVPYDLSSAEDKKDLTAYRVKRTGNSFECRYDPRWMNVKVLAATAADPKKAVEIFDTSGSNPAPIVFDYAGATRNHITYTVQLRKMTRYKSGGTMTYEPVEDSKSPPIVFSVMPSGRIRLGTTPGTYAD